MGLQNEMQRAGGKCLKQAHRLMGFKIDYTVVPDTSDPTTVVLLSGIFVMPTQRVLITDTQGNLQIQHRASGGLFAAEAQPVIHVSRESLKDSAGVRYEPTDLDTFVEDGQTQVFYVRTITDITPGKPAGWFLSFTTRDRTHASGHRGR